MAVFLRVAVFAVVHIGIGILLWWGRADTTDDNYLAATLDKFRRVQATDDAEVGRLLLVGGSSVAFGCRADRMEAALERPVVNLGLVGGLGLEFQLREAAALSRPGDEVLLMPEYELLGGEADRRVLRQILDYRPATLRWVPSRYRRRILLQDGMGWVGGLARQAVFGKGTMGRDNEDPVYRRSGFNAHGDFVGHHGLPTTYRASDTAQTGEWVPGLSSVGGSYAISESAARALKVFLEMCRRRDVTVYWGFPPYPEDRAGTLLEVADELLEVLKGIEGLQVLEHPRETLFADSAFFDTGYHLNAEAGERRTRQLIDRLSGGE